MEREFVRAARTVPVVLYDLKQDIGEKTNVADQHPEIAEKIGRDLVTPAETRPTGSRNGSGEVGPRAKASYRSKRVSPLPLVWLEPDTRFPRSAT